MKNLSNTGLFILLILILFSCNDENTDTPKTKTIDIEDYQEYGLLLKNNLNDLAENLRNENVNFSHKDNVLNCAEKYYDTDSEAFFAFSKSFNDAKTKSHQALELTPYQKIIFEELEDNLLLSKSAENFILSLNKIFQKVYDNENLESEEKDTLLTFIITYKTSVEFLKDNLDIVKDSSSVKSLKSNWWKKWGKCAASIGGGAVGGAIAGGELGFKVGTVLASPIKGTIIGGTIGAIGGALAGAALGC